MSRAQLELQQMVLSTSLVQPVSSGGQGGAVWVLSRQLAGQEKPWLRVIEGLLSRAEEQGIDLHVCRRYVHKSGKMVFGWYVEVSSKGVRELIRALEKLRPVFEEAKPRLEDSFEEAPTTVRVPSPVAVQKNTTTTYTVPGDPKNAVLPQGVLKRTSLGLDERGEEMTMEEMALPHTTRETNVPKHQFGRGARVFKESK